MVLIRQSYAILVIAIVEFLIGGVLALLALPRFRLTPDWAYYPTFSPLWILFGFLFLRKGIAVARVYSPGWELERSEVEDWLEYSSEIGKKITLLKYWRVHSCGAIELIASSTPTIVGSWLPSEPARRMVRPLTFESSPLKMSRS